MRWPGRDTKNLRNPPAACEVIDKADKPQQPGAIHPR
jgi:hypothetical protein